MPDSEKKTGAAAGFEERLNEDGLVKSEGYAETMNGFVLPRLAEMRTTVEVAGAGGKKIVCDRYDAENPKGTVFVLHGFTECAEKFSELIFSLIRNGWSVAACDQRGHGRSWRDERIRDVSLTHVSRFDEYTEDLKAVWDRVLAEMPKPRYLFAHSMGGAVALRFLEEYPGLFEKAALCAPMVAPHRAGLPLFVGKAMCIGAKCIGRGTGRIPMSRPWDGPEDFETSCAAGKERFDWYDGVRIRTEIYRNNGPTFSWALEAFNVTNKILAPGKPESISVPVRIYTAENDSQVLPEYQEQLVRRLPRGKRKVVPGSKHEIYRSADAVLFPWWKEILAFFESGEDA